jgi:hypothetical protein
MKAATEARRNKEIGSYQFVRFFRLQFGVMLKTGRKAQV